MIEFKEDTHEYFLGKKKLISVTQLMRKHGLAPSYDGIPSDVLRAKAERGTLIHKEIEEYIKDGTIGFTDELTAFREYIESTGVIVVASETKLYNDIVAGTADLVTIDGGYCIADLKTTSTLHKEAVSWQLSIYAALYNAQNATISVQKGQAYHFIEDGKLRVVDIPLKPLEEVERLFECERKGEIYKQSEIIERNGDLATLANVERYIKEIEVVKKHAEEKAAELRQRLMAVMEEKGMLSFESDEIKLTYVAPTTRQSIDSTRLKKELPEIAAQYTKESAVKASLRVTIKEAK